MWMWGKGMNPGEDHTYQMMCVCPACSGGGPSGTVVRVWKGGITVDGKPAYPVAPNLRCVEADTC